MSEIKTVLDTLLSALIYVTPLLGLLSVMGWLADVLSEHFPDAD
jgi:positive regulator of sigma E activity